MQRIFILFFFLFSGFSISFGQLSAVSGSISKADSSCDFSLKQFQVLQKKGVSDSLVWTRQDTLCNFHFSLELKPGAYFLRIKNLDGEKAELAFEIKTTGETIELGNIIPGGRASELEGVTITGVPKRFIQIDAEKTIVTVEGNPILEVSSVYDAILKLPGVLPYPGGGFAMGGQMASVYFDGIPSPLSTSDLENLLKSLPATSVHKIELISNPGASYDASFSGAIIDIISQGRVSKWLSGTVTLNTGFNRNQKYVPSFMLSGKGKKYTWQLQTGYVSYKRNNTSRSERHYRYFDTTTVLASDRREFSRDQNVYFRPTFTYKFNQNSFLQLNVGSSFFLNDQDGNSSSAASVPLQTFFKLQVKGKSIDLGAKYRIFLDTLKRKLEIGVYYNYLDYTSSRLVEQQQGATTFRC